MGSRIKNEIHGEALEKALSSVVKDVVSRKKHVQGKQKYYKVDYTYYALHENCTSFHWN